MTKTVTESILATDDRVIMFASVVLGAVMNLANI